MNHTGEIKIVECPRDAMQGILDFIPTALKIEYINALLNVGFDTLDCGSFVSPKIIPQMRDTIDVLPHLDISDTDTKISVIVANERGARDAVNYDQVHILGFPFSVSETFQKRNTNKSIRESIDTVRKILEISSKHQKEMVVYLSMAFGNPYGDDWNSDIVSDWIGELSSIGIEQFSVSDTVGVSTQQSIEEVFIKLQDEFEHLEVGAHFHTTKRAWKSKVHTAFINGCRKFDGAIRGYGGCPMAKDELVGNMPTENLIEYFDMDKLRISEDRFKDAFILAKKLFNCYL